MKRWLNTDSYKAVANDLERKGYIFFADTNKMVGVFAKTTYIHSRFPTWVHTHKGLLVVDEKLCPTADDIEYHRDKIDNPLPIIYTPFGLVSIIAKTKRQFEKAFWIDRWGTVFTGSTKVAQLDYFMVWCMKYYRQLEYAPTTPSIFDNMLTIDIETQSVSISRAKTHDIWRFQSRTIPTGTAI